MKAKLFFLAMLSVTTLAGCNTRTAAGKLPSGGTTVDLSNEEGQTTLKNKLEGSIKAYQETELNSIGLALKASDINLSAAAKGTMEAAGELSLDLNLKGFGGEISANAEKVLDGQTATTKAAVNVKTNGGKLSLSGKLPGQEENTSVTFNNTLNLGGAKAAAYLTGSKIYADISGNEKLAKGLDTFANGTLDGLKKSAFGPIIEMLLPSYLEQAGPIYDATTGKFVFETAYAELDKQVVFDIGGAVDWPTIDPSAQFDIESALVTILSMKESVGLNFVTYSSGAYGLSVGMTKDTLKTLAGEDAGEIDKYIQKFEVNASVYFNKNLMLESAGVSWNVEAKIDNLAEVNPDVASAFTTCEARAASSGSISLEAKYNNVKVTLPSETELAKYKEIAM